MTDHRYEGARTPEERLTAAWGRPPGFVGWLSAVNHKDIGLRFIVTALVFLVVGGILALLIRMQLALPESEVLGTQRYNEAFTLHGTTMMFLFAVPILEGLGMYFVPLMLGTRDLPFPRLNAFGYWAYLFGGIFLYASFLTGEVPDKGWFAYVPLSGPIFSPDRGMDFWLLGVTFVEIAAIVGAIELIVAFTKRRAPGMTLRRIPVFAWAILVMAVMMLFAFPALVTASALLEIERVFGTRFFDAAGGGDPLLWQHLFWFFGHPEVYIMFLPAAGIVSMVIPVFSRRRLAGYALVVAALVAIGLLSFVLWIHHMFTVGLSIVALSFFAAMSFVIVIPSSVQIFAWIATLGRGTPRFSTPMLYMLGFLVTFIVGGITGVMVASVPFDWQVHDSFFVVAHFHYVLIGGVVFPILGGLHYWFPKLTGRLLNDTVGRLGFWTSFVGFNVAFFPQHIAGLSGMPRRIATYRETDGWLWENLLSSIGAFVLAAGVLIAVGNALRSLARGAPAGDNPWEASSLEWATSSPPPAYNFRTIPEVESADPLWDEHEHSPAHRKLARDLADAGPDRREVIETDALSGEPERIVWVPGPSLWPLATALAAVAALIGALLYSAPVAAAGAGATLVCVIGWVTTTVARRPSDDDRALPFVSSGAGFWGCGLALAAATVVLGSLLFGYVLLWPGGVEVPPLGEALAPLAVLVVAALSAVLGLRAGRAGHHGRLLAALAAATVFAVVFVVLVAAAAAAFPADPTDSAYGSIVAALLGWHIVLAVALLVVLAVVTWVAAGGGLPRVDDVVVATGALLAGFLVASWLLTALVVYGVPRLT